MSEILEKQEVVSKSELSMDNTGAKVLNAPSPKKLRGWVRDVVMNKWLYILSIPVIVYFLIFNYAPMVGIIMGFQDFKPALGLFGSKWVGFQFFREFFTSPTFWQIIRNTFMMSFLSLVIEFPLTIIFALLLNEVMVNPYKKIVQTISYLPYFVSLTIVCGLILEFCSFNGPVTDFFVALGMNRQNLLTNPNYFWTINLVSNIWTGLGYGSIIFIASITSVSSEHHEAATIDGANRLQRVWHVTIPAILPTIITMLILKCGMLMTGGFEKILLLYNPSIYSTADTISTHVQRLGIEKGRYGYATAVGLFNSVINTALLLLSNWLSRKAAETSIF